MLMILPQRTVRDLRPVHRASVTGSGFRELLDSEAQGGHRCERCATPSLKDNRDDREERPELEAAKDELEQAGRERVDVQRCVVPLAEGRWSGRPSRSDDAGAGVGGRRS